ncbi:Small G protein signaling modulator 1 [Fasciolopsis buskii]|uniref:Small G protein signaling modulator 1 n=1 Tax=Fasciolopsis buskii TaxID=27845 RepID=A0A8E0VJ42_9TREM|nr:Small G protein signaling modulator 1 [Fasciolopsis buski]
MVSPVAYQISTPQSATVSHLSGAMSTTAISVACSTPAMITTTTSRAGHADRSPVNHSSGQRFVFSAQQHSSTSSTSSGNSGGVDGLYQPRRHQLMFAKNNVLLGNTRSHSGYLAVYCNLSGVNLRWTSNELLLQASTLLHQNTQPECLSTSRNKHDQQNLDTKMEQSCRFEKLDIPRTVDEGQISFIDEEGGVLNCASLPVSDTDVLSGGKWNSALNQKPEVDATHLTDQGWHGNVIYSFSSPDNNVVRRRFGNGYYLVHLLSPQDSRGVLVVFVATDGIQYPPLRLPGGWKPSLEFLSSLELGLSSSVRLEPNTETVRIVKAGWFKLSSLYSDCCTFPRASSPDLTNHTRAHDIMNARKKPAVSNSISFGFGRQMQFRFSSDASPGPPNPFRRLLDFCSLKSNTFQSPTISSDVVGEANQTRLIKDNGSSAMQDLTAGTADVEDHSYCINTDVSTEPDNSVDYQSSSEIVFRLIRSENSTDPFLDRSIDSESSEPKGLCRDSMDSGCSIDSLSDALDGIKRKLIANVFHIWLTHSRYMKVIKVHLADSVRPGTTWPRTPNSPLSLLTPTKWNKLFWDLPEEHRMQHIREAFTRVLESVQKDVIRCDRNHHLFHKRGDHGSNNLAILRRVLITYVWEHLEDGYTQGMCDLIAPLLALFLTARNEHLDIEVQTYSFFVSLMKLRLGNLYCATTSSVQMDRKFASLRALVQVMDPELNAHIQMYGDFAHFYFCYRWFLLDFKREFKYNDIFRVWETLIAASHLISDRFELFIALALIQYYRDVIISAQMEFTDILKFFNGKLLQSVVHQSLNVPSFLSSPLTFSLKFCLSERAEKHSVEHVLDMARKSASEIQDLLMIT